MFSMNRFEGTSAMQTPFPPANATPGAHSAPWTISLETKPPAGMVSLPLPPNLPPELRLHSCESFRPAVTRHPASSVERGSSGNEVDSGLRDGIPWAHDLVESCLESVRSNGNSFTGITGICHGKKCRAMKT